MISNYTNTAPSILHFNGNGKDRMDNMLKYYRNHIKSMGYNEKNEINRKIIRFEYDNGTETFIKIGELCPLQ